MRLNLEESYFGAILVRALPPPEQQHPCAAHTPHDPSQQVDRGDRISWTGDAHVAQAASMAAFDNFAFVLQNLARSANDCNGIESYCIYWCLSLVDYFRATNDTVALALYQPYADAKLEHAHDIFGDATTPLTFFGWDDRLGSGFLNASTRESQWDFRFLALRAWSDWAGVMDSIGNATAAAHWRAYASAGASAIRAQLGPEWTSSLGVHAAAEALNAPGFATPAEVATVLGGQLNDVVRVCSLSNFNQYWLLQALGNGGAMDKAVASIHRCWGDEVRLVARVAPPTFSLALRPPHPRCLCLRSSSARHHSGRSPTRTGRSSFERGRRTRSPLPCPMARTARRASATPGALALPHGSRRMHSVSRLRRPALSP